MTGKFEFSVFHITIQRSTVILHELKYVYIKYSNRGSLYTYVRSTIKNMNRYELRSTTLRVYCHYTMQHNLIKHNIELQLFLILP